LQYRLPGEEDHIVGAPVSTPDGRIVFARQGYADSDAGLVVLQIELEAPESGKSSDSSAAGYNLPTSREATAQPDEGARAVAADPGRMRLGEDEN
jgi:hypothetical protein